MASSTSSNKRRFIDSAPTFRPAEDEFSNPLKLIKKLKAHGERYGVIKIVTPEKWRPKSLPVPRHKFESYRQAIHALKSGAPFKDGNIYSFDEYKTYAEEIQNKWTKDHRRMLDQYISGENEEEKKQQWSGFVRDCYWDIVEGKSPDVSVVDYASNLPVVEEFENGSQWNFKSLIKLEENILNKTGTNIPGVTTPWIYLGCLFATFCWHVEDQFLYSMNYLHSGANKIWYGIPSSSAVAFEEHAASCCLTRSKKSDLLYEMTRMVSPYDFPDDVKVWMLVQRPGDLVITFPEAFHGGYSEGWNCAEAVNFGLMDWLPFGKRSVQRYNRLKDPILSNDKLIWDLMQQALEDSERKESIPTELRDAFLEACKNELDNRVHVMNEVYKIGDVIPLSSWRGDPPQCCLCKTFNFFSFVYCECMIEEEKVLCLKDCLDRSAFSCGCEPILCTEVSDDEIKEVIRRVETINEKD